MFPWQPVFLSSWFSAREMDLLGNVFPLGPWRCWAWVRRNTEINPHQPIRRICRNLEVVPSSTNQKNTILGMLQPNSHWVLVPLSKFTKTCAGKISFFFLWSLLDSLLWDELYGLSWNCRNWKKWGKISQILNAVTLSRPKRVFFSGKLFTLSWFCSVKSHNHLVPDIVSWLGSFYNNFSSVSDLLCMVILLFFPPTGDELLGGIPQKTVKMGKKWRFVTFPSMDLLVGADTCGLCWQGEMEQEGEMQISRGKGPENCRILLLNPQRRGITLKKQFQKFSQNLDWPEVTTLFPSYSNPRY